MVRQFLKRVFDIRIGLLFSVSFLGAYLLGLGINIGFFDFLILDILLLIFGIQISAFLKCVEMVIIYKKSTGLVGRSAYILLFLFAPSIFVSVASVLIGLSISEPMLYSGFLYVYVPLGAVQFIVSLPLILKGDMRKIVEFILNIEKQGHSDEPKKQ